MIMVLNRSEWQWEVSIWSDEASFVDEGDKTIPGPGTHENVRMNQTNPPTWRLGTDTERNTFLDKFHFQYPPPNNYDPKF